MSHHFDGQVVDLSVNTGFDDGPNHEIHLHAENCDLKNVGNQDQDGSSVPKILQNQHQFPVVVHRFLQLFFSVFSSLVVHQNRVQTVGDTFQSHVNGANDENERYI